MKNSKLLILTIFVFLNANAFKQGIHEDVTEFVLIEIQGFDEHSADEVGDSNYNTDYFEPHVAAAHADDNRLDSASVRLVKKRIEIADALESCNRRTALDSLGEALHTVQDIYSHSNSVDDGHPIEDLLSIQRGTAFCFPQQINGGNHFSNGLVTGYFNLLTPIGIAQCLGTDEHDCCHYHLNKDNASQFNGANFINAYSASLSATTKYLELIYEYLIERFSPKDVGFYKKMLKNIQRKTVYVVDTTGSMEDNIVALKTDITSFLDEIAQDNSENNAPALGLVTFKDENEISSTGLVCNISDFRENINNLEAYGGDDCPEASGKALVKALEEFDVIGTPLLPIGGDIILYTDATPLNQSLVESASRVARSRGVKVNSIIDGDCVDTGKKIGQKLNYTFSNNTKTTHLPYKLNDSKIVLNSARDIYQALAEETGGVSFQINKEEVDNVLPITNYITDVKSKNIYSREITLESGVVFEEQIKIDSSISTNNMLVLVKTMDSSNAPDVGLFRPDNTEVLESDTDVTITRLSTVVAIKIDKPNIGNWKIILSNGSTNYLVRVFAKSNFGISNIRLQQKTSNPLRHVDYVPIIGNPTINEEVVVQFHLLSIPQTIMMKLVRQDGTLILKSELIPVEGKPRFYETSFTIPNEKFYIRLSGNLDESSQFQREFPIEINPNKIKLKIIQQIQYSNTIVRLENKIITVYRNSNKNFQLKIQNASLVATTYIISLNTDTNMPISFSGKVSLAPNEIRELNINLIIPNDTAENTTEELMFRVQDENDEKNSNYVIAKLIIKPDTLFGNSFE